MNERMLDLTVGWSLKECELWAFWLFRIKFRTGGPHRNSTDGLGVVLVESKTIFLEKWAKDQLFRLLILIKSYNSSKASQSLNIL